MKHDDDYDEGQEQDTVYYGDRTCIRLTSLTTPAVTTTWVVVTALGTFREPNLRYLM
jgi:hypothetical protein